MLFWINRPVDLVLVDSVFLPSARIQCGTFYSKCYYINMTSNNEKAGSVSLNSISTCFKSNDWHEIAQLLVSFYDSYIGYLRIGKVSCIKKKWAGYFTLFCYSRLITVYFVLCFFFCVYMSVLFHHKCFIKYTNNWLENISIWVSKQMAKHHFSQSWLSNESANIEGISWKVS